ncbi:hypothetical protein Ancab_009130 [Ancistrocladus abbreviatus]
MKVPGLETWHFCWFGTSNLQSLSCLWSQQTCHYQSVMLYSTETSWAFAFHRTDTPDRRSCRIGAFEGCSLSTPNVVKISEDVVPLKETSCSKLSMVKGFQDGNRGDHQKTVLPITLPG